MLLELTKEFCEPLSKEDFERLKKRIMELLSEGLPNFQVLDLSGISIGLYPLNTIDNAKKRFKVYSNRT